MLICTLEATGSYTHSLQKCLCGFAFLTIIKILARQPERLVNYGFGIQNSRMRNVPKRKMGAKTG